MSLTKAQVQQVRKHIDSVLKANGMLGFNVELGNARYNSTEITFKLVATAKGATSTKDAKKNKQVNDLPRFAKIHGIDPTKTGAKGEKLIEYHTSKPKYPFIYETVRGARYKATPAQAKRIFA